MIWGIIGFTILTVIALWGFGVLQKLWAFLHALYFFAKITPPIMQYNFKGGTLYERTKIKQKRKVVCKTY